MQESSKTNPFFNDTKLNRLQTQFWRGEKNIVMDSLRENNPDATEKELHELYVDEMLVRCVCNDKEDDIQAAEYFATFFVREFFDKIIDVVCSYKRKHLDSRFKLVNLTQLIQDIDYQDCYYIIPDDLVPKCYFILDVMKSKHFQIQLKSRMFQNMQNWVEENKKSAEFYNKWSYGVYTDVDTKWTILKIWFNQVIKDDEMLLKHMNDTVEYSLYDIMKPRGRALKAKQQKRCKNSKRSNNNVQKMIKC